MTDTPAIGEHPDTDSDETRTLCREMVTALVNDGTLTDDRWTQTFLAVPRHVLVPTYYQANKHIDGPTNRERWLQLVYSDTTLITQHQPDAVTSSGTMPSLVATMLQALEIEDDHRVLHVGNAQGPFIGPGYFMRHRTTPNASPSARSAAVTDEPRWQQRTTDLPASVYYDNDFRFFLDKLS